MINNAQLSVDTFLYLSGFLVSYIFYKTMQKTKGRFNIGLYYLHRYIRLTPAYAMVLAYIILIYPMLGRGPSSYTWDYQKQFCVDNWWTNLLYVNNLVNAEEICMGHTWYLACDMQLFIVAPLILYPLYKWRRVGYVLLAMAIVSSIVTPMVLTNVYNLPPSSITFNLTAMELKEEQDYMNKYYYVPYSRSGPYVVGMVLGYMLAAHGTEVRIHKVIQVCGWVVSTVCCLAALFGIHGEITGTSQLSMVARMCYNGLARTGWGVGLAWITFACVTGHGGIVNSILSWNWLLPLSRLTYCAYLFHWYVLSAFIGRERVVPHLDHPTEVMNFLAVLTLTYFISFFLSVFFESPFIVLDSIAMGALKGNGSRKNKVENTNVDLRTASTRPEL
jgi:peptidoglycan/LPS O-acetylase OafA/YrhL